MSQLPKVRVSQLLCGLLLLTTCYTALGQSPPPTTGLHPTTGSTPPISPRPPTSLRRRMGPPPRKEIHLKEPNQIKQSEGSTIALKFTWDLDRVYLQYKHDYEIDCEADIDGQRDRHNRVGSEVATSITIWRLNANQDYKCCITVEIEREDMDIEENETKFIDCKSVHTDTVKQLSSTAAIAMIAVAVVLFVVMTIVCVVLCIVVYKRRIKNVR